MTRASQAANLRTERVWSSELPFELPISTLVAARDWARARRGSSGGTSAGHPAESSTDGGHVLQRHG